MAAAIAVDVVVCDVALFEIKEEVLLVLIDEAEDEIVETGD